MRKIYFYYKLKWLKFKYKTKFVIGILLLITLPSVAVGSLWCAVAPLGAIELPSVQEIANGNVNYWFICLAVVAVGSWTYIGRQLLKQLEQQRNSNTTLVAQMFEYMDKDRQAVVIAITESTAITKQLLTFLQKKETKG